MDKDKRIAELEAEVAENDEMFELQRKRTVDVSREWRQATGNPDVWPDLGTLIDWLRGDRARLRAALEAAKPGLENFVADNPTFQYGDEMQDPEGAHAALKLVIAALTSTEQHEPSDTERLHKLERWLRTHSHSDERAVVIRDNGIVRGCPSYWLGQDLAGDVVGVTLRSAIDALKEAPRG